MSSNAPHTQDGPIDYRAILRRFLGVNEIRLVRARESLRSRQVDFLDLLPLMLHINHPMLPAYTSKECPNGVRGYEPDKRALEAAVRQGRSFQYVRQSGRELPILGLYFMGSPGSVAYSGESDFDIWLCHDPQLDESQLALLKEKTDAISSWAASDLDLEVHFFLINPEAIRRGDVAALSSESSGSAQYRLLVEEFYRTGLRLAGLYPLWWMVPPEREHDYDAFVEEFLRQRHLPAKDFVDLGGVMPVPAEEFFGAAVWQLYKGIDSPYKSVLKLLLIESYARDYPETTPLSTQYKRAVFSGETNADQLDPYLMMMDRVELFLWGREETTRLELARRCFYLKVNEQLTSERAVLVPWRRQLLRERVDQWGWKRGELLILDGRHRWNIQQVGEERRVLFEALSESYRFLSDFARRFGGQSRISQRDLTILGRKLYAAFERKPGKVELLTRGMNASLVESQLSLHEVIDDQHISSWLLYRGAVKPDDTSRLSPLKRAKSLSEVTAWCFFNGVADRHSAIGVYTRLSRLAPNEFRSMLSRLESLFPNRAKEHGSLEEYGSPARIVKTLLFVNAGLDPFLRESGDGRIATGRSDALSYGGTSENLVMSIDQISLTSWQEVLTFRFAEARGVMDCLCDLLKWSPPEGGAESIPVIEVASFTATTGPTVARRVEELFNDLLRAFHQSANPRHTRYVIRVERGYYVVYYDDIPRYRYLETHPALLGYLASPLPEFSPVVFDRYATHDNLLPLIYQQGREGVIQFFYQPQGSEVSIWVLDERGSLFHRRLPFFDGPSLLSQFDRFFESVLNRISFLMQEGEQVTAPEGVEFYAIERNPAGGYYLQRQYLRVRSDRFLTLQVMVDVDEGGNTIFTLYCGGKEFSTLDQGGRAFAEVVNYVLELRQSGQAYPVYITDIGMSPAVVGEAITRIQTIHFLNYKHRIEEKLSKALSQIKG